MSTKRDGDDRIGEIALVPVLVKRQARAGLIAIDQARVGAKLRMSASVAAATARSRKQSRKGGQGLAVSGSSLLAGPGAQ
jgi:hypothetical protein